MLRLAELGLVSRLSACIQSARLDIQGQLLLTLHEVIRNASSSASRKSSSSHDGDGEGSEEHIAPNEQATGFLLHTLVDGLSFSSNLPVLPEWTTFVVRTVPLLRGSTQALLSPLSDSLVARIARLGDSLRLALEMTHVESSTLIGTPSDLEVVANLDMLELVASLAFRLSAGVREQGARSRADSSASLRGYVGGVFGGEGPSEESVPENGSGVSLAWPSRVGARISS